MEISSAKWVSELVRLLCNLYRFLFNLCIYMDNSLHFFFWYILFNFTGNGGSNLCQWIRHGLFRLLTRWASFSIFFRWELLISPRSQSQKGTQLSRFSNRKSGSDRSGETGKTAEDKQLELLHHRPYDFEGCFFLLVAVNFFWEFKLTPSHYTEILWPRLHRENKDRGGGVWKKFEFPNFYFSWDAKLFAKTWTGGPQEGWCND